MPSFLAKKTLKSPQPESNKRSNGFRPFLWAWRTLSAFLMVTGLLVVMGLFSLVSMIQSFDDFLPMDFAPKALPKEFILYADLHGKMLDFSQNDFAAQFLGDENVDFISFIRALHMAVKDDRVMGIQIHAHEPELTLVQIQTLREAIDTLHKAGKKTWYYTANINGIGDYWLASAFEEIWVQPVGLWDVTGIRIEQPYLRDALDKIGVEPEVAKRGSYKTAPEMFVRSDMSPYHRKTLSSITNDFMNVIMDDVFHSRKMPRKIFLEAINRAPLRLKEAKKLRLIDRIGYKDQITGEVLNFQKGEDSDEKNERVLVSHYLESQNHVDQYDSGVVIIPIEGAIMDNDPTLHVVDSSMGDDGVVQAHDINQALVGAANDDDVDVIMLWINSPGGSPNASETIRRTIDFAKHKGKYIIAVMGDVAASGGYWVASAADEIFASNITITGSIGVYGGKPNLSAMWEKLGINWEYIGIGDNAGIYSPNKPYSQAERARVEKIMDMIYGTFVHRVAQGRDMNVEDVNRVAQGRAWSGKAALKHKLIDQTGGMIAALKMVADRQDYDDWTQMPVALHQEIVDPFDELFKIFDFPVKQSDVLTAFFKPIENIMTRILYPDAYVLAPDIEVKF